MSVFIPPRTAPPQTLQPSYKAGPVGPGAGVLLTEYPLTALLGDTPQKRMRQAYKLGVEVPWIRAAERAITGPGASVDWHLEDENDDTIVDSEASEDARRALQLIEKPQANVPVGAKLHKRELWALTLRHVGLCGNAFWYLDGTEMLAGTPTGIVYIRPDRMDPAEDANGNLEGWWIDRDLAKGKTGIAVRLDEILHFKLDPPDTGHFGIGLVESALLKAHITTGLDRHVQQVIAAGGRLSGILGPKGDEPIPPDVYQQLIADFRTIVEQQDAAKRLQVIRGPVEFTKTTMTPQELMIRDMMVGSRDDLLALWNVPVSRLGIHDRGNGLGASEVSINDDAVLWQGAIHPRLDSLRETIQYGLLDRWLTLGETIELVIDEPSFDDEAPKYDLLTKITNVPLRNREVRAIIGLDPFGPKVIGPSGAPLDEEIWTSNTIITQAVASEEAPRRAITPQLTMSAPDRALLAAGETSTAPKGSLRETLAEVRATVERQVTPTLRSNVRRALDEQLSDVAQRLRRFSGQVVAKPSDTSVWWDAREQDRRMMTAIQPAVTGMAQAVSAHISLSLRPQKAYLDAVDRALTRGAARVVAINERTRAAIAAQVAAGISEGRLVTEIANSIQDASMQNGQLAFDEARAEVIARTELMDAYNGAALSSYSDAGLAYVEAIDGDQDEECASRNGRTYSIAEADSIEDHPNGTLDWLPVLTAKAVPLSYATQGEPTRVITPTINIPAPIINFTAPPVTVESPVTVNVPEQPATVVNLPEMVVNLPAPQISVEAPIVNLPAVPALKAADVQDVRVVEMPKQTRRLIYDNKTGKATGSVDE